MPQKQLSRSEEQADFRLESFTITSEPVILDNPTPEELALREKLLLLAEQNPKAALSELFDAIGKYPNSQQFYQYICASYSRLDEQEKLTEWICKTYELFPNYLFAKCTYAEVKMLSNLADQVPAIFNNTFSLQSLYPERSVFHVTEVLVHANCMVNYFCAIKKFENTKVYIEIIRQFNEEMAEELEEKIFLHLLAEMPHDFFASLQNNRKEKRCKKKTRPKKCK